MAQRKPAGRTGAPDWMVTYGDCMGLLLCFFILLASMSEVKDNAQTTSIMESLRRAFGGHDGAEEVVPVRRGSGAGLIERLLELELPGGGPARQAEADAPGLSVSKFRVARVDDGLQIVVDGRITFDRFSATLNPEARALVAKTAELLAGYHTKILVRGHTSSEPLPEDSLYEDPRDLSYARAKAVALELERNGVHRARIVPVAAGDTEALARPAYTEERRALNRRVEILVTEDLVDDYGGSASSDNLKESS